MIYPVVELNAQVLAARLAVVTVENGSNQDFIVERPAQFGAEGWTPKNGMCLVEQGPRTRNDKLCSPGNPPAVAYDQDFNVTIFIRQSDKDTTPIDQLVNLAEADALKAITTPALTGGDWSNMDGNAMKSKLSDPQRIVTTDGQFEGVTIVVTVTYRTAENDPYTQR